MTPHVLNKLGELKVITAGFPFTGIWTIGPGADCDYPTLAAAVAATPAAGTLLLVDAGTHACSNVTLPDGVHLAGWGMDVTTIQTSTNGNCLLVGDGSIIADLTAQNTYSDGVATTFAIDMHTNGDTSRFENVKGIATNSAAGTAYSFRVYGATLVDCEGVATAAGSSGYCLISNPGGASTVEVYRGRYNGTGSGTSTDVGTGHASDNILLRDPILVNGAINLGFNFGSVTGWWYDASGDHNATGPASVGIPVTNTSGATVAAGAVGYIDEAGEFKTTTTAYLDVNWCVVLSGGANNAMVYVARRGLVTITLNGNCSVGDKLYTSTTAGQAQPQSYMRPEMLAIAQTANASGAGGTCEALLYCYTRFAPLSSLDLVIGVDSASASDFVAKIDDNAGAHGGQGLDATHVPYDTVAAGNENVINPLNVAAGDLVKMRLYNSTRSTYRLITDLDAANNVIDTVNTADAWADNDDITVRSQTCNSGVSPYFVDLDLSQATSIPGLARGLKVGGDKRDTGGTNTYLGIHPWITFSASKEARLHNQVAANLFIMRGFDISLYQRRFCWRFSASGAGTASQRLRLEGMFVAAL